MEGVSRVVWRHVYNLWPLPVAAMSARDMERSEPPASPEVAMQ